MDSFLKIKKIKTREVLDSKGYLMVEVELKTNFGNFKASAPSGVSTGEYEAVELRDTDGKGVKKAIENIEKIIAPILEKEELVDQKKIDDILIDLDGTKNKSHLGANAILPVSIAVLRALADAKKIAPYKYISEISGTDLKGMPRPSFNMIEGGKHASNGPSFQEFMVIPRRASFKENFEEGKRVYKKLNEELKKEFKQINLSAEGAFSVPINTKKALNLLFEAGYANSADNRFAIDAAASSFYKNDSYKFDGEVVSREKLITYYQELTELNHIISIEDPFFEEDFDGFAQLKNKLSNAIIIFGDDLTTSNIERIKLAEEKNACNGLILKPNQIGTVTETIEAAKLAESYGWKIMVSNRGGETEDSFIADLAVGIGAEFIKSGAPFPKERMAKYNRLVKIEEELYV